MSRSLYIAPVLLVLSLAACKRPAPVELVVDVRLGQTTDNPGTLLKGGDRVARSAGLTFTAQNNSPAVAYMMLFIVDAQKRVFWLVPSATPGAQSMPLANNRTAVRAGPVTLGDAAPGTAQVMALFSDRPLPALAVNEQVHLGGYQVVRSIDGVTEVQTYPLVLE